MALLTSTLARGLRCPLCGAAHATCGEPSTSIPLDAGLYDPEQGVAELQAAQAAARAVRREEAGMAMVKVDRGDGILFKFTEDDAQRYLDAHPEATRVGEAPSAEAKAVRAAANKAVPAAPADKLEAPPDADKAAEPPPSRRARS